MDGENKGVHAFLTRIRNDNWSVCDGVRIEDMVKNKQKRKHSKLFLLK